MTLALIGLVDRELTEQPCRQWAGIALIRLGEKLAFDLRALRLRSPRSRPGSSDLGQQIALFLRIGLGRRQNTLANVVKRWALIRG